MLDRRVRAVLRADGGVEATRPCRRRTKCATAMLQQLGAVVHAAYTFERYYIDDNMRSIPTHYHAHARPHGGFFGHGHASHQLEPTGQNANKPLESGSLARICRRSRQPNRGTTW